MAYYTELRSPYTFGPVPSPTYWSKEDGYPGGSEYLQRMNQPEIDAMLQYMDAQELNDPSAVLRRKLQTPPTPSLEENPITVLRRNTDRARNYPRDFSEMFAPSMNPEGDIGRYIPNKPAVSRSAKVPPRSMGPPSTGNVPMPVKTQTSATQPQSAPAQGGGLLDIDTDFFDDPTRMGLLQAGLGLLSAPQYSTNPNDVTLGSALARGLGGYIQGYGGTKKRLSEAERQRIEDDWKRTQMEKDSEYKDALIQMYGIQGDAQRKNAELNATEKQLQKQAIAAQVERILKHEGKLGNTTRRLELNRLGTSDNTNQQNQFADLFRESTTDRTPMEETLVASGKYTEEDAKKLRFTALETQYNKTLDLQTNPPKPPTESKGDAQERAEDILITAEPGSTDIRVSNAFDRIYSKELGENRTFNANTNREEVTKIYPVIPQEIEKKFPELVARRRQLEQGQSVKPPSLSQQQEENRAAALEAYHNEIVENNYDQPEPGYSFQGLKESISPRLASDEYLLKIRAQDRWVENVLRAASGAAIAQSEYADKRAQYFPEPGEGQPAIEAKRKARDIVLQQAKLNLTNQMEQARKQEALPKVEVEDPDAYLLE